MIWISSCGIIICLYYLNKELTNRPIALASTTLIAVATGFTDIAFRDRGYAVTILLSTIAILLSVLAARSKNQPGSTIKFLIVTVLFSTAAIFTEYIALILIPGIAISIALNKKVSYWIRAGLLLTLVVAALSLYYFCIRPDLNEQDFSSATSYLKNWRASGQPWLYHFYSFLGLSVLPRLEIFILLLIAASIYLSISDSKNRSALLFSTLPICTIIGFWYYLQYPIGPVRHCSLLLLPVSIAVATALNSTNLPRIYNALLPQFVTAIIVIMALIQRFVPVPGYYSHVEHLPYSKMEIGWSQLNSLLTPEYTVFLDFWSFALLPDLFKDPRYLKATVIRRNNSALRVWHSDSGIQFVQIDAADFFANSEQAISKARSISSNSKEFIKTTPKSLIAYSGYIFSHENRDFVSTKVSHLADGTEVRKINIGLWGIGMEWDSSNSPK